MTATSSFIYWKEEPNDRKWRWIPNKEQARSIAIGQGAMFMTWTAFSHEPKNGKEPIRYGDLPLDFDNKEDPEKALDDMRNLCLIHLPELYDVDPIDIQFFCSGSKGFHAVIPAALIGTEKGDPRLPLIYKRMASRWADSLSLKTLDLSLYAMGKGKMFRLPNVRRSNGRYKVPLTLDEVQKFTIKEVWNLSEKSRTIE